MLAFIFSDILFSAAFGMIGWHYWGIYKRIKNKR